MRKSKGQDEAADVNYKQLAKVKYLAEQCQQLSNLKNHLQEVSGYSKELLQLLNRVKKKDQGNNPQSNQDSSMGKLQDLHQLMGKIRNELIDKKEQLENRIAEADRNKKEDQMLYRRVLLNYEEKISELKETVLNREGYIQKLQKSKRENKSIAIDKKLILANTTNIELFTQFASESGKLRRLARENLELKVQINRNIDEIRRQENVLLKLKMAKQTNMPYFKFKDIMKNGIQRMSDCDKQEYKFITGQPEQKKKSEQINQKIVEKTPKTASNETLYLLLKKQELNGQILKSLIEQQIKKQDQYQERNAKLKQALRMKQQQQMCKEIGKKIQCNIKQVQQNRWESMSVAPGSKNKKKQPNNSCSKQQYRMYLEDMAYNLKARMAQVFHLNRRYYGRSKSQQPQIRLWPPRELDELKSTDIDFKESFYQKCNNFITERFYDDDVQYEVY